MRQYIILVTIIMICLSSCKRDNCHNEITLSYQDISTISDKSFIIIDGRQYIHTEDFQAIQISDVMLPSSYVRMFGTVENPIGQKTTSSTILTKLSQNLNSLGLYSIKQQVDKSQNLQLILERKDGNCIEIKYSKDYPINVRHQE